MKILFVCKWNRFRSKFSEAYFNQINKNKKVKAGSIGILEVNVPMKPSEINRNAWIKKKYGIALSSKSKGINVKDLDAADKIIVVADDVPLSLFGSKGRWKDKLTVWKIKDAPIYDKSNINKIVDTLKKKIEVLVKQLENKK